MLVRDEVGAAVTVMSVAIAIVVEPLAVVVTAELERAGQSVITLGLMRLVSRLDEHEHAALLRQQNAGLMLVRGGAAHIAAEHRGAQRERGRWLPAEAHARRGDGINRASDVLAEDGRRSEGVVEEDSRGVRGEELLVRRHLPDAEGKVPAVEIFLKPQFVKPHAVVTVDVTDHIEIAHEVLREARTVRVEHIGIKGRIFPSERAVQIHTEAKFHISLVNRALAFSTEGIAQDFRDVEELSTR